MATVNLVRFPIGGTATYSASSTFSGSFPASKAADGSASTDWASAGEQAGAWWQVDWTIAQSISQIILRDRSNTTDKWKSGVISFSNGSTVNHGSIPDNGSPFTVDFGLKTSITWMRVTSSDGTGSNIGLAEVEAYNLLQGYSQAQTHIGPLYVSYGQATGLISSSIKITNAQAQAYVGSYRSTAQAQAYIKATSSRFAQTQARVKVITFKVAQAQAFIDKAEGFAKKKASIKREQRNNHGQAKAQRRQFNRPGVGQANAWIDQISGWKHGLAMATIVKTQGYGQTQAKLWDRKPHAQAQAYITVRDINNSAQVNSYILHVTYAVAQANALINIFALAQAQAKINSFLTQQYAQAQGRIPATLQSYAQTQSHIAFIRPANHAQANAQITTRQRGYAQAGGTLQDPIRGYGQAGAKIYYKVGLGQASAYIYAGPVFDNLQVIEERVNPKTQIHWAKMYTLRPTSLGTTPPAQYIPERNPDETPADWRINGPDAVTIVSRVPPIELRTGISVDSSIYNNQFIYSDAGPLQTDEWRRINTFLFSTQIITENPNDYKITSVRAFTVHSQDAANTWDPTLDWYHLSENKSYFGRTGDSASYRPAFYIEATTPPWDSRGWNWTDLQNIGVTVSAREGNFGEGAAATYIYFVWIEVTIEAIGGSEAFLLAPHRETHEEEFNPVPSNRIAHATGNDLLSLNILQVQSLEGLLGTGVGTTPASNAVISGDWTFQNTETYSGIRVSKANIQRLQFRPINRPSSPLIGWVYYDGANQQLWYYAEDGWKAFALEGMYGYDTTHEAFAQAQVSVKSFPPAFAQTMASVRRRQFAFGQSQSNIKHIVGLGQTQAKIQAYTSLQRYSQAH